MRKALLILIVLAAGVMAASGQNCDHKSNATERFEAIRLLPPAKVTYFDGKHLEYVHSDRLQTNVGSFEISPDTAVPKTFDKRYKAGHWWLLYCSKCRHLYFIAEIRNESNH